MSNQIFNFQTDVCEITDKGRVRPKNEDAKGYAETVNGHLFVVCDGMGGHVGGQVASNIAVESIVTYFSSKKKADIYDAISSSIKYANLQIFKKAKEDTSLRGMGTTVVLLLVQDDKIYIGHVGDSRIYIHSDGKLHRISKDHSYVQGLVDSGAITDDEAETHPRKNELMRALGIRAEVKPEVALSPIKAKNGDTFLLCSDGLNGMVNDLTMEATLNKRMPLKDRGNELLNFALNAGGTDNITLQLLHISNSDYPKSIFISKSPVRREIPKTDPDIKSTQTFSGFDEIDSTKTQNTLNDIDNSSDYKSIEDSKNEAEEGKKKKLIYIAGGVVGVLLIVLVLFFTGVFDDKAYRTTLEGSDFKTVEVGFFETRNEAINAGDAAIAEEKYENQAYVIVSKNGNKVYEDGETIVPEENKKLKVLEDIRYQAESGIGWSALYKKFGVCKCFVLQENPPSKFGNNNSLNADTEYIIPVRYSSKKTLNPDSYKRYSNAKVGYKGGRCVNLDSDCNNKKRATIVKPKENNTTTNTTVVNNPEDNSEETNTEEINPEETNTEETVIEDNGKGAEESASAYLARKKVVEDKFLATKKTYETAQATTKAKTKAYKTTAETNGGLISAEKKKSKKNKDITKIAKLKDEMRRADNERKAAITTELEAKGKMDAAELALNNFK